MSIEMQVWRCYRKPCFQNGVAFTHPGWLAKHLWDVHNFPSSVRKEPRRPAPRRRYRQRGREG